MNKQQRNQWEQLVADSFKTTQQYENAQDHQLIVAANAYILKLERELQNIKGGRKIAAILKSKVEV